MPFFGGIRANAKYNEGTKLLNRLARIDDPTALRDTLRRAIESLTAATELKPDFGPAWHNLGHAYYDSGRLLVEAANALEASNELTDAGLDARVEFFRDSAAANYVNSLKVLDVAVKLMPDAAAVHNSRGRTLVVLHRDEEASNEFKIASEIDPSNQAAKQNQNTLGVVTKAEEISRELTTSLWEEGDALYNAGKYTESIYKYNEIIALCPGDSWAYYSRGSAYRNLGEYQFAISDQTKVMEIGSPIPNHIGLADPYIERGISYQRLGYHQLAIEDFDKAIELDPDADSYCIRGNSHRLLGQNERAMEDYDKAIEMDPDNAEDYNQLKQMLRLPCFKKSDSEPAAQIEGEILVIDAYDRVLATKPIFQEDERAELRACLEQGLAAAIVSLREDQLLKELWEGGSQEKANAMLQAWTRVLMLTMQGVSEEFEEHLCRATDGFLGDMVFGYGDPRNTYEDLRMFQIQLRADDELREAGGIPTYAYTVLRLMLIKALTGEDRLMFVPSPILSVSGLIAEGNIELGWLGEMEDALCLQRIHQATVNAVNNAAL